SGGVDLRLRGGWLPGDASPREPILKKDASRRRKSWLPVYSTLEIQVRSRDEANHGNNEMLG
ncbi:hypothetical protein NDU88_005426, partial [Pleurodeles waltl]